MPIITQPLSQLERQPSQPIPEQTQDPDEKEAVPPASQSIDRSRQVRTPEPRIQSSQQAVHPRTSATMDDQRSPGHIPTFDWDEFEKRYERALSDANDQEKELLDEFDRLVKVTAFSPLSTCSLLNAPSSTLMSGHRPPLPTITSAR